MEQKKKSFWEVVVNLPANFWYACLMEILERLAFFGVRAITPLFLVASAGEKGLGLDYAQKGVIYMVWALLQCLIPMVSGGFTDRYGYRKSLAVAFTINIMGYIGMANSKPLADYFMGLGWEGARFWVFMVAACLIGTGTAVFKPPAHGTIAKSTDEASSSLGWGIFYWTVNIGGALAPMGAALLRVEIDWHRVFYAAAIVTACNFLPAFLLYKEPEKDPEALKKQEGKGILATFSSSIATIFGDLRLVVFLGIFSCFWLMFMQLWDLMPNFIDEWVNTSDVAPYFAWFREGWVLGSGQVKPEMIININPMAIIVLVIPISWLIGRIRKVAAMVIGMIISLVGFVGAGYTGMGLFCCVMILVFSIGEMACSPTFSAYVGLIAPKDKKALYMGYSNIPFAIGWAAGNGIGGMLYERMASKFNLAREYMVDYLGMDASLVMDQEKLPKEQVMETMARVLESGDGRGIQQAIQGWWEGLDVNTIPKDELTATINDGFTRILGELQPAALDRATQVLWELHHPQMVWIYLGAMGLLGTVGMILFYLVTRKGLAGGSVEPAAEE